MRRFSFAVPGWWRDPAIKGCNECEKLLLLFLSQGPHMEMTGVGYLPGPVGAYEMGWTTEKYDEYFASLERKELIGYDPETCEVFVLNFEGSHSLNPKHYMGVRKAAESIRSEKLKKMALEMAEKRRSRINFPS